MKNFLTTTALIVVLISCTKQQHKQLGQEIPVVLKTIYYDGVEDDLLTAGLGLSGLRGSAPQLSEQPTAASLRQASYYHQFRALNDLSVAGGYGSLYGISATQKPIAGYEYWSQRSVIAGVFHTTVLQIPDSFDLENACLVVAPSSGSRNVFGAVGTSGTWALVHGCAVVYTDKGTGTEVALLENKKYRVDGLISDDQDTMAVGTDLSPASALHVVQKHPYSQVHPEQYWGEFVLDAAAYGLALLQHHKALTRQEIKVIAASVSNGGGAVLRAAEADELHLLDAVVAAEPQVNLNHSYQLSKAEQTNEIKTRALLALSMNLSLYEPCAALHESLNETPFKMNTVLLQPLLVNRCQALADLGLLAGDELAEQSAAALQKIDDLQIEPAALALAQLNTLANMWATINHSYSNSYLQQTADDNLCQSAMAAFTAAGIPRKLSTQEQIGMFALSNGIAPGNGIELAHTNAANEVQSKMILAPNFGLDSQRCFVQLLSEPKLQEAIGAVYAQPEKNQIPTLLLHGQADGTVAINHASRAYYHRNQSDAAVNQNMRYYEIENAQHFDAFLAYPGFNQQFVPMHPYFEQAMDLMYRHLESGDQLPKSHLIKTQPRGMVAEQVPALNRTHIPIIENQAKHLIQVNNNQLVIQ